MMGRKMCFKGKILEKYPYIITVTGSGALHLEHIEPVKVFV